MVNHGKSRFGFDEDVEIISLASFSELFPILSSDKVSDPPEKFDKNMQAEAEEWYFKENLKFRRSLYELADRLSLEEKNSVKSAYWHIRAAVALSGLTEWKSGYTSALEN